MAPQKGKTGTKGQKQILEENLSTLNFYRNMIIAVSLIYIVYNLAFGNVFSLTNIFFYLLVIVSHGGSYRFMSYMANAKYTESGQLLDSGTDLNMEGGLAEHTKDLIILTSGCQLLSIISNYFWLLWLLAPGRAFYILWTNFLGPYFMQSSADNIPEVNEKKQKKLERRQKRQQNVRY
ncbi:transmembrane protein 208 isoform X2 [Daktulosphaira vitifoliae]|uniref:transmembrane protein 208 isoform X2 n=1 Tax=Daktulosphaira vitifoliae TaxID=58002 RepID=UPI0021A97E98|nr:transmembrane protein 208 isoform X2 [Daktulosphaira vitifoliae]